MNTTTTTPGGGATAEDQLEQVRARIRAAGGAAEQARRSAEAADRLEADAELLRRRLPVVASAADQARRHARSLRGGRPAALWLAVRGQLAGERSRRAAQLQAALAAHCVLAQQIGEEEAEARALRAEVARLRSVASALPRLLDQAAACVRGQGGAPAEALAAAEGGLEPVLRREADLDQAMRWTGWAQAQLAKALDRLGAARTFTRYDGFLDADGVAGRGDGAPLGDRSAASRAVLTAVRDVVDVMMRALADLEAPVEGIGDPTFLTGLETWFEALDTTADAPARERITDALARCEQLAAEVAGLRARVSVHHAATRRVLEARRAQWCLILRGA